MDRILEPEKLTRQALMPGSGSDPDLIRKVTEKLAAALEVQGFLIAVLPEERLQRTARAPPAGRGQHRRRGRGA